MCVLYVLEIRLLNWNLFVNLSRPRIRTKMVNKQYNIQGAKKAKNNSPPPNRSASVISSAPNPSNISAANSISNENNCAQSDYGRNITYVHNDDFGVCDENCERLNHKDLSINDIGRFQYILQMDREMVSFFWAKRKFFFSTLTGSGDGFFNLSLF